MKNKIITAFFFLILFFIVLSIDSTSFGFSIYDSEYDVTVDFGDIELLDYTFVTRFYTSGSFLSMHQYHVYSMPRAVYCYPSEDGSAISFRTSVDFTYYQ